LIVGEGASAIINQQATASEILTAAQDVINNNDQLKKISDNVKQNLKDIVENDAELSTTVAQTSALQNLKDDKKGIGDMVNGLLDSLSSIFKEGKSTSEADVKTMIKSSINTSISNSSINITEITNAIETHFSDNKLDSNTLDCKLNAVSSNVIDVDYINIGKKGSLNETQKADATGLVSCLQSALKTDKLINEIISVKTNDSSNKTNNKNKSSNSADQSTSNVNSQIHNDDIIKDAGNAVAGVVDSAGNAGSKIIDTAGDALAKNNPFMQFGMYIAVGLFLCCFCSIGGYFFSQSSSSSSQYSNNNEDTNYEESYNDESYYQYGGKLNNSIFNILSFFDINTLLIIFILILFIIYIN
jgi:ElaB/YqjD/DUF883 family membrane-anchored ribosome-binding protein